MLFRLHFVLNLLTFTLEKFVKLGTIEWWWPWRAYKFSELEITCYATINSPSQGIFKLQERKNILLLSISLLNLILAVVAAKERYFFLNSWEFPTFIHHRCRWFSLKHVSVERREESEEKKAKSDNEKKNFFYCFLSV